MLFDASRGLSTKGFEGFNTGWQDKRPTGIGVFVSFLKQITALINNFSQYLTAQGFYVVAIEKDAAESVFHFLLEKLKNVYYNPTDDVIDNYLYLSDTKPVVLKNMVSEAPTETVEGV